MRLHHFLGLATVLVAGCQSFTPGVSLEGTGDASKDVAAVQAAVDAGGTVRLRGTFDFGDKGRVSLRRDVELIGAPGATIKGGFFPFSSPLPEAGQGSAPGPKIAIRNLKFDGALYGPINIGSAREVAITGNRISGLRAFALPLPNIPDGQAMSGVFVGTAWSTPPGGKRQYLPGVLSGKVTIEDNVIELAPAQPAKTLGYGMMVQYTTGMDASIRRNTITGATRTCIEFIDNFRGPDGSGRVVIADNRLQTNTEGLPFPGAQTPNAVLVGYFADRAAAADPARAMEHVVENNVIETRGATSMGVAALAPRTRVTGNRITSAGEKSTAVLIAGPDMVVSGNKMSGRGASAVAVNGFGEIKGARNRLADNDLGAFQPTNVHVSFGKTSEDNTCAGQQWIVKVSDEGLRNRCP